MNKKLLMVVLAVVIVLSVFTVWALTAWDPLNQIVTRTPEGGFQFHGKIDGVLFNYIIHGPQPGDETRYVLIDDGHGTGYYRAVEPPKFPTTNYAPPDSRSLANAFGTIGSFYVRALYLFAVDHWFGIKDLVSFAFDSLTWNASAAGCTGTGNCFWVGGTGNFSSTAHWATTSGGGTTGGLPAATDAVTFDASSGAGTATQDNATFTCGAVTMTNSSVTVAGSSNLWKAGGNWGDNITTAKFSPGTSTVEFTANATATLPSTGLAGYFYALTVDLGTTTTLSANTGLTLVTTNGTLALGGHNFEVNATTGSNSPVTIGGSGAISSSTAAVFNLFILTTTPAGNFVNIPVNNWTNIDLRMENNLGLAGNGLEFRLAGNITTMSILELTCTTYNNATYNQWFNFQSFTVTTTQWNTLSCLATEGFSATSGSMTANDFTLTNANDWMSWGSSTGWNITSAYTSSSTNSAKWSVGTGTVRLSGFNVTGKTITLGNVGNEFNNLTIDPTAVVTGYTFTIASHKLQVAGTLTVQDSLGGANTVILTDATNNLGISAGVVSIGTNGNITMGSATIKVSGNWSQPTATAFTYGTSTVEWAGSGTYTATGFNNGNTATVYNLTVDTGVTVSLTNTGIGIGNLLTVSGTGVFRPAAASTGHLQFISGVPGWSLAAATSLAGNGATPLIIDLRNSGTQANAFSCTDCDVYERAASTYSASMSIKGEFVTGGGGNVTFSGAAALTLTDSTATGIHGNLLNGFLGGAGFTFGSGALTVINVTVYANSWFNWGSSTTHVVTGTYTNNSSSALAVAGTGTVTFNNAANNTITFSGGTTTEFNNVVFTSSAASGTVTYTMGGGSLKWATDLKIQQTGVPNVLLDTSVTNYGLTGGDIQIGANASFTDGIKFNGSTVSVTWVQINVGGYFNMGSASITITSATTSGVCNTNSNAWCNLTADTTDWSRGTSTVTIASTVNIAFGIANYVQLNHALPLASLSEFYTLALNATNQAVAGSRAAFPIQGTSGDVITIQNVTVQGPGPGSVYFDMGNASGITWAINGNVTGGNNGQIVQGANVTMYGNWDQGTTQNAGSGLWDQNYTTTFAGTTQSLSCPEGGMHASFGAVTVNLGTTVNTNAHYCTVSATLTLNGTIQSAAPLQRLILNSSELGGTAQPLVLGGSGSILGVGMVEYLACNNPAPKIVLVTPTTYWYLDMVACNGYTIKLAGNVSTNSDGTHCTVDSYCSALFSGYAGADNPTFYTQGYSMNIAGIFWIGDLTITGAAHFQTSTITAGAIDAISGVVYLEQATLNLSIPITDGALVCDGTQGGGQVIQALTTEYNGIIHGGTATVNAAGYCVRMNTHVGTPQAFYAENGTFNVAHIVIADAVDFIQFGGSTWNITGNINSLSNSTSWDAGSTAVVNFIGASAQLVILNGEPLNLVNVSGAGEKDFTQNFASNNFTMTGATVPQVVFTAGITWTLNGQTIKGYSPSAPLKLRSNQQATGWNLIAPSGATATNVDVSWSNASQGGQINALNNDTDSGHNQNWNFGSGSPPGGCTGPSCNPSNPAPNINCAYTYAFLSVQLSCQTDLKALDPNSITWYVDGQSVGHGTTMKTTIVVLGTTRTVSIELVLTGFSAVDETQQYVILANLNVVVYALLLVIILFGVMMVMRASKLKSRRKKATTKPAPRRSVPTNGRRYR